MSCDFQWDFSAKPDKCNYHIPCRNFPTLVIQSSGTLLQNEAFFAIIYSAIISNNHQKHGSRSCAPCRWDFHRMSSKAIVVPGTDPRNVCSKFPDKYGPCCNNKLQFGQCDVRWFSVRFLSKTWQMQLTHSIQEFHYTGNPIQWHIASNWSIFRDNIQCYYF